MVVVVFAGAAGQAAHGAVGTASHSCPPLRPSSYRLNPTAPAPLPPHQMLRYTVPFMVISGVFWLLHTWILDPMPNKFKRQEFIRYRREMLHVASKLNFRTPAREVRSRILGRRSCSNMTTQSFIDA